MGDSGVASPVASGGYNQTHVATINEAEGLLEVDRATSDP
jgi:hypothetical protein